MSVAILFLILTLLGMFFFISPSHWLIIFLFIILKTLTFFLILKLILKNNKYPLFYSSILLLFLTLLALKLFEPVNIILATSFFTLVFLIIK